MRISMKCHQINIINIVGTRADESRNVHLNRYTIFAIAELRKTTKIYDHWPIKEGAAKKSTASKTHFNRENDEQCESFTKRDKI